MDLTVLGALLARRLLCSCQASAETPSLESGSSVADLGWIVVERWDEFQHGDVTRNSSGGLVWVKNFTRLLYDDEYLALSPVRALILHRIWLAYAQNRCRLRAETRYLNRRLALRVRQEDLEALNHAGFISFSACKPQADDTQAASGLARAGEEEKREREERVLDEVRSKTTTGTSTSTSADSDNGHKEPVVEEDELLKRLDSTLRDMPF